MKNKIDGLIWAIERFSDRCDAIENQIRPATAFTLQKYDPTPHVHAESFDPKTLKFDPEITLDKGRGQIKAMGVTLLELDFLNLCGAFDAYRPELYGLAADPEAAEQVIDKSLAAASDIMNSFHKIKQADDPQTILLAERKKRIKAAAIVRKSIERLGLRLNNDTTRPDEPTLKNKYPDDLMTLTVAIQEFGVSRATLKRAIQSQTIKSYQKRKNSSHLVSRSEVENHWPKH